MPKRNDAKLVDNIKIYNKMFPYLMPKRSDSLVYYSIEVEMTNAVNFIRKKNKEAGTKQYRLFDVVLASMMRTMALRPAMNRFLSNYRYWQRAEHSFNFVVKKDLTEEAPERNAMVKFEPAMTFEEIAKIISEAIEEARTSEESGDETVIKTFLKLPSFMLRFVFAILKWLDKIGRYPKALRDVDGLHVSAFVANLGSINISNPPLHHLYEWGTTSLFVTMGKLHRKRLIDEHDNEYIKDTLEMGITVDERIAEGFYFMRTMKLMQYCLEHPESLDEAPDLSKAY